VKHVLIVDSDLGFTFWLGEVLSRANYQPWPASTVSDAIAVMNRKPAVSPDVLIVDSRLSGASRLIARFRRQHANLKVVALGSSNEKALPGVDAWHKRADPGDSSARQKWVRAIGRISHRQKHAA